jgi:uncharacterized protein YbjT (DUF2867 family)
VTILVTGATDTVGRHLIRELVTAGVPARALVRSIDVASPLRDLGIEPIVGAFEADESLRRAPVGAERVSCSRPPVPARWSISRCACST